VADCFVQQDAAVPWGQNHRELTGRCWACIQQAQGLPGRLGTMIFWTFPFEVAERHTPATPAAPGFPALLAFRERPYAEAHQGLGVSAEVPEARADQDLSNLLGKRGLHLYDAGVVGVCRSAGPLQQRAFVQA
jgi:hypothetical protein